MAESSECPVCTREMRTDDVRVLHIDGGNAHVVCATCAPKLDKCPICRAPIEEIVALRADGAGPAHEKPAWVLFGEGETPACPWTADEADATPDDSDATGVTWERLCAQVNAGVRQLMSAPNTLVLVPRTPTLYMSDYVAMLPRRLRREYCCRLCFKFIDTLGAALVVVFEDKPHVRVRHVFHMLSACLTSCPPYFASVVTGLRQSALHYVGQWKPLLLEHGDKVGGLSNGTWQHFCVFATECTYSQRWKRGAEEKGVSEKMWQAGQLRDFYAALPPGTVDRTFTALRSGKLYRGGEWAAKNANLPAVLAQTTGVPGVLADAYFAACIYCERLPSAWMHSVYKRGTFGGLVERMAAPDADMSAIANWWSKTLDPVAYQHTTKVPTATQDAMAAADPAFMAVMRRRVLVPADVACKAVEPALRKLLLVHATRHAEPLGYMAGDVIPISEHVDERHFATVRAILAGDNPAMYDVGTCTLSLLAAVLRSGNVSRASLHPCALWPALMSASTTALGADPELYACKNPLVWIGNTGVWATVPGLVRSWDVLGIGRFPLAHGCTLESTNYRSAIVVAGPGPAMATSSVLKELLAAKLHRYGAYISARASGAAPADQAIAPADGNAAVFLSFENAEGSEQVFRPAVFELHGARGGYVVLTVVSAK